MGAAINQLVSYVEKHGQYRNVPVTVAVYNLKSSTFAEKFFLQKWITFEIYTEELSVILVIKSLFF